MCSKVYEVKLKKHQNFFFNRDRTVLDKQKLIFFQVLWIISFKQAENSCFFCMACLYMPRSMSDILKLLILKIIIFENFCQYLKLDAYSI